MFSSNTSGHGRTTRGQRNAAASTSASGLLHGSPTSAQRTPRAAVAAAAQAPSAARAARDRALLPGQYTPGSSTAGAGTGVRPLGTPATAAVRRSVGQLVHSPATTRLEQRRLRGKQHWRASLTGREPEDARRFSARCDAVRKSASTALTALLAVGTDAGGNELGQIALDEEARKDYNVFKSIKAEYLASDDFLDPSAPPTGVPLAALNPASSFHTVVHLANLTTFLHIVLSSGLDAATGQTDRLSSGKLQLAGQALLRQVMPAQEPVTTRLTDLLISIRRQAYLLACASSRTPIDPLPFFSQALGELLPPARAKALTDRAAAKRYDDLRTASLTAIESTASDWAALSTGWRWQEMAQLAQSWVEEVARRGGLTDADELSASDDDELGPRQSMHARADSPHESMADQSDDTSAQADEKATLQDDVRSEHLSAQQSEDDSSAFFETITHSEDERHTALPDRAESFLEATMVEAASTVDPLGLATNDAVGTEALPPVDRADELFDLFTETLPDDPPDAESTDGLAQLALTHVVPPRPADPSQIRFLDDRLQRVAEPKRQPDAVKISFDDSQPSPAPAQIEVSASAVSASPELGRPADDAQVSPSAAPPAIGQVLETSDSHTGDWYQPEFGGGDQPELDSFGGTGFKCGTLVEDRRLQGFNTPILRDSSDMEDEVRVRVPAHLAGSSRQPKRQRASMHLSDDEPAPPSQRIRRPVDVVASVGAPGNRYFQGRNAPGGREPWSAHETRLLEDLLRAFGANWARMIKLHGAQGTVSQDFARRTNMSLRDKAVNMKLAILRAGARPPPWLDCVTVPLSKQPTVPPEPSRVNVTDSESSSGEREE
ncbi:uncharacterized protein JCM10292_006526 [Rhodotorula paludigena]|uniref:uncharacterized protein n=1 Tax=Rhodotorula paludigena TaxID=86838 RepID=UPI0031765761